MSKKVCSASGFIYPTGANLSQRKWVSHWLLRRNNNALNLRSDTVTMLCSLLCFWFLKTFLVYRSGRRWFGIDHLMPRPGETTGTWAPVAFFPFSAVCFSLGAHFLLLQIISGWLINETNDLLTLGQCCNVEHWVLNADGGERLCYPTACWGCRVWMLPLYLTLPH